VLDEGLGVALLTRATPEPVLERCERADPPHKLDQNTPEGRGQVEPEEARALRDREPSQEDEDDERQVEEENEVGEEAFEHGRVILVPFQRFESKMPITRWHDRLDEVTRSLSSNKLKPRQRSQGG